MTPQVTYLNPKFDIRSKEVERTTDQLTLLHNAPTLKSSEAQQFGDDRLVGIYTIRERQEKIAAFRQKKLRSLYRKHVKYISRKRLAEMRPRISGRFIAGR